MIRFIFINLIIVIVLLAFVNWVCGVYLRKTGAPSRSELPNFEKSRKHARAVFRDYGNVKHQYEPFVGWKTKPYTGKTTTIGFDGIRQHKSIVSTDSATIVRFFGGSTTWGEGSDDNHTIPALFDSLNPNYKVYNHGQLAYNSRQNLDALISLYNSGVKSDLVIFYDGVNDAAFLCPTEVNVPGHRLVPMFRNKLYIQNSKLAKDIFTHIFLKNVLQVIKRTKEIDYSKSYNCLGDMNKAEAIAEFFVSNWEIAHDIVTKKGGRFVAVLQPSAFIGNPKVDHIKLDRFLDENFKNVYQHIQKKIRERNYDWVYDLTDRFDKDEYIYIDFCHVSPNGNEIIAKRITELNTLHLRKEVSLDSL